MFKRKLSVDQNALDDIRKEIEFLRKFEVDAQSDAGKNLLELCEVTIQNTIKEFATKEVEKFDTDAKLIFFLASCRSKLQTLMELKALYTNAGMKIGILKQELEKILPKEE